MDYNNSHKERVLGTPIAENAMTGVALRAALCGLRPIHVHLRNDFLLVAMDQIANYVAKWQDMFDHQVKVPLVIRSIIGRGWGCGAQHSQALHGLFAQVPGLKVVMPSTPYDVKGLFLASVADAQQKGQRLAPAGRKGVAARSSGGPPQSGSATGSSQNSTTRLSKLQVSGRPN